MKSAIEESKKSPDTPVSQVVASPISSLAPALEKHLPKVADDLMSLASLDSSMKKWMPRDAAGNARLRAAVLEWLLTLVSAPRDAAYLAARRKIGSLSARAGFEMKHVVAVVAHARATLSEILQSQFVGTGQFAPRARALNQAFDFDLSLICDAYSRQTLESLQLLNQQLEQTTLSLAQASATKDEFLAHVSHELRTPLNSILGFTRLILDGLCESREEEQQMLRDIFDSSELLLRLVNDLLDLARVNADQFALQIRPAELRQLLDATLPLVTVQAQSKKIQVIDETLDSDLPLVLTDELRFRQVLLNVLSNAVKFTDKGAITIRAFPHADENTYCLEIEDTGLGVPAAERTTVFKKFTRATGTSPQKEGVGLGLAIAKQMIERMGGRIGLESGRRGKGTVIWFTVPLAAMNKAGARRETTRKHNVKASA